MLNSIHWAKHNAPNRIEFPTKIFHCETKSYNLSFTVKTLIEFLNGAHISGSYNCAIAFHQIYCAIVLFIDFFYMHVANR